MTASVPRLNAAIGCAESLLARCPCCCSPLLAPPRRPPRTAAAAASRRATTAARQRAPVERDDAHALGAHEPARRDPLQAVDGEQGGRQAALEHRGRRARGLRRAAVAARRATSTPGSQIRVPGRPNGRTGWVREEQLSNLKTIRTHLTIDRGKLKATLRKNGKRIWTSRVGVGKRRHGHARRATSGSASGSRTSAAARSTALGVRHLGLLGHADRLAGRRRRRHPRHEPARADPGPPVARLRPRPERARSAGWRS